MSKAQLSPVAQAERAKLRELREVFAHTEERQDGLGVWWAGQSLENRRLILAFCGLDDSEKSAARRWQQLLMTDRDLIVDRCASFLHVIMPLRFH